MASSWHIQQGRNEQPPELFRKSTVTDITLLINGKELHFVKYPLTQASDVLTKMIETSADQSKLQIDDVAYEDMILFLECLHPKKLRDVNETDLEKLLKIAKKFQHQGILAKCEQYIVDEFSARRSTKDGMYDNFFYHLKLADKFGPKRVLDVELSSERLKKVYFSSQQFARGYSPHSVTGYENDEHFCELSSETKLKILADRLKVAEKHLARENSY